MKQFLFDLVARLGGTATRALAARLDDVDDRLAPMTESLAAVAARLEAVDRSREALHRAVEDLAAIPSLATELVDGITDAEARAAGRLADVERLLAGR